MKGTTISISALAYRWGFNSNAHFSRIFKREFDTTPSEFLKRRVHESMGDIVD
ncbi:helix-turn-helix domain-containing protein [Ramlibacter sp. WS9]|uniref:helix-turn-helix domain-containing protein n=1 Tax=Ramlibacter sp. WS9 TaxID=1882741 RepID=UPI00130518F0|nr:helix-turn-helix domain-containing protein [Ramlibacter sp. WS9]